MPIEKQSKDRNKYGNERKRETFESEWTLRRKQQKLTKIEWGTNLRESVSEKALPSRF